MASYNRQYEKDAYPKNGRKFHRLPAVKLAHSFFHPIYRLSVLIIKFLALPSANFERAFKSNTEAAHLTAS